MIHKESQVLECSMGSSAPSIEEKSSWNSLLAKRKQINF